MLNASRMTLADLHAYITLKLQIYLTIPQYVVHHPVHISYSVCRYYSIHCPPPVYTLRHQEAWQRWSRLAWGKPKRSCIRVTADTGVTKIHACAWSSWRFLHVIKCNSMFARDQHGDGCWWSNETPCLRVAKLEMFARDQMPLHACAWISWRFFLSNSSYLSALNSYPQTGLYR